MNDKKSKIIAQVMRFQTLINRHQKQHFVSSGLSGTPYSGQGRVLSLLKTKPNITQKELTSLFGMTKQAVGQLLDKLEKSGYITRETSKEDRRVSNIKLTEAGAATARELEVVPHERGKELDCLNDEELDTFSEYLERIIKRFEELDERIENDKGADDND